MSRRRFGWALAGGLFLSCWHALLIGVLGSWLFFLGGTGACIACIQLCRFQYAEGRWPRSNRCTLKICRPARLRAKGCLLIWLVLSPTAPAVQVWQQGHVRGHPVFNTGGVPVTNDRYDLSPVRHPDAPVVDRQELCRPAYLKDICVFRAEEQPGHQLLVADIRLHEPLIGTWVCRAFGLSDSEWHCRRLQEPLPAFPSEQYVLSPRSLPWHRSHIPVDLRPVGGPVLVCDVVRCQTCGDVVLQAVAGRAAINLREGFLCRCSQGWFLPSAYLTLLPCGDTLQVWSAQALPTSSGPAAGDSLGPATLEDRFALSLDRTSVPEVAFHEAAGNNAVIIGVSGHVYGDVPTYADHHIIRSAALQAFLQHERGSQEALHFARILPPLDGLPAIQFAAVPCGGTDLPSVGDMRPIGGQLVALNVPDRALPYHCVQEAVRRYGEPDPRFPLHQQLQAGALLLLNNERVVVAFAPLLTDLPRALVIIRRQPARVVYGAHADEDSVDPGSSLSSGYGLRPWFAVSLSVAVARYFPCGPCDAGFTAALLSFAALLPVAMSSPSELPPPLVWQDTALPNNAASVGLAPQPRHARLASQWQWGSPEHTVGGPSAAIALDPQVQHYLVEAYSPSQYQWFWVPGTAPRAALQEPVSQLAVAPGRGEAVLASPQLIRRSVQLVVPARDSNLRTILVDVGVDTVCLDVPRANAGKTILEALDFLFPRRHFRLDVTSNQPLRHGDVVVGLEDKHTAFEIGPIVWPSGPQTTRPSLHSEETAAEEILLSAVDLDLLPLRVPSSVRPRPLASVLSQWLGRQRCLDIDLHVLDLPAGLPRAFCLPRRGCSTLVVVLFDVADTARPLLIHAIDVEERCPPTVDALRRCLKHGSFWDAVLARRYDCSRLGTLPAECSRSGFGFTQLWLEVDIDRAVLFGLRLTCAMRPSPMDIRGRFAAGQAQQALVQDAARQEAAVQTLPAHWHPIASPLFSVATPVRRATAGCVLDTTYPPVGTLFHLECPYMGVHCTIPCTSRRHIWALRIGDSVRGLCTPEVSWTVLSTVIGVSAWDLPGIMVHDGHDAWEWPDELATLAGSCGHLFLKDFQQRGGAMLAQTLAAAGHDSATRQLFVAFDSQASTVDLLSLPYGHSVWWIIRDGLSRELLRPVAPWYNDREIRVVTINAHGQASRIIYSEEVAALKRLPQGARGIMSEPLPRVIGHLTNSGLALTEVSIGTVVGSALAIRPCWILLGVVAWSAVGVSAMQQAIPPELSVATLDCPPPWSDSAAASPACTHTLRPYP